MSTVARIDSRAPCAQLEPSESRVCDPPPIVAEPTFAFSGSWGALSRIYELLADQAKSDLEVGRVDVATHASVRDAAAREREEATKKECEAKGDGHEGFFDAFASLFEDIFVDLLTFRADAIAIDTTKHFIDMAQNPRFWRELSEAASTIVKWVGRAVSAIGSAAMIVVGTLTSEFGVGVGLVALGALSISATATGAVITESKIGGKDGQWAGLGLELGGAALSFAGVGLGAQLAATSSQAALAAYDATRVATSGLRAVTGASAAVAGAASMANAGFAHRVELAAADGAHATRRVDRENSLAQAVLGDVRSIQESNARARAVLAEALTQLVESERCGLAGKTRA